MPGQQPPPPTINAADARQRHWNAAYGAKAPTAVSWYQESLATSLAMIDAAGIGRDAWILDVGGGASTLVDALIDRGRERVTVLDVSSSGLEHAKARLGARGASVDWVLADVTTWRPPPRYGLWHDRATFHFLTEEHDRRAYVRVLHEAVAEGGQVIIATFALDGPERCSGLPVVRWSPEGLAAELGEPFAVVDTRREDHVTPTGVTQRFVFCRFARG